MFFFLFLMWKWLVDEWWRLHGYNAPHLQKLVIQILSQTVSHSGCERNWNVFERIHTKRMNRLEHQRLNDLIYVHYNLRLKNWYKCFLSYFEFKLFHSQLWIIICFSILSFITRKKNLWSLWLCMHWWDWFLNSWWGSTNKARCWRIRKSFIWKMVNSNK